MIFCLGLEVVVVREVLLEFAHFENVQVMFVAVGVVCWDLLVFVFGEYFFEFVDPTDGQ